MQYAGRSTWQLVRDRRFGAFIVTKGLSLTGVWIHNVVAALLAWNLTHSAAVVSAVSVVQFAPQLVLAPLIGPLTDRLNRGLLVAYGRILCTLGSGGLAAWVAVVGQEDMSLVGLLGTTAVMGLGFAVGGPAMQAIVSDLVDTDEVGRAVGLDSVPTMLGRALGPALGALLLVWVGAAGAFAVAAIGHAAFGLVMARVGRGSVGAALSAGEGRFLDALRYVRRTRVIGVLLLGVTAVGIGADPVITLAPALADSAPDPEAVVGYLGSAFGGGAVLGSMLANMSASLGGQRWSPTVGLVLLAAGLGAVPWSSSIAAMCAGFLISGVGFTIALSGCTALLHEVVPQAMRGRVMALWLIAFTGSRPLAAAMNGLVADSVGVEWAVVVVCAGIAIIALATTPVVLTRLERVTQ